MIHINKKPMGHIAHLRKTVQINKHVWLYIITLIKRRKNPSFTLWKFNCSSFEQTWILFIQGCIVQVWLKLAQRFWRRRYFNFVNVFLLFHKYLPWNKGRALHLNKLESSSPKDVLCQVWLKLAQWFWWRRFFNFVNVYVFLLFHKYLPLKRAGPSFEQTWNPFT